VPPPQHRFINALLRNSELYTNIPQAITFTYAQLDLLSRLQSLYPFLLLPPNLNASSALHAFHSTTPHPLISPLAIEGLHQIGVSTPFATLRSYTHLGIKYATLTHNCHNVFADAALTSLPPTPSHPHGKIQKAVPLHGGVSSLGRDLITEMNRLGLIVDLSHTSAETMRDVLGGTSSWDGSRAPIIFSHSSAYSLCPHPRNVPDSILDLVKAKRGLVMVNFSPDFISCIPPSPPRDDGLPDPYPKNETLAQVADHVMYIGQRIGWGHVGFGSDFDGIEQTPRGLEDVSKYPQLVKELLDRGVSDEEAGMVVGGNLLRVWREVDEVAEEMRREGAIPREDDLPNLRPE
jgi:membrane dipeptidase